MRSVGRNYWVSATHTGAADANRRKTMRKINVISRERAKDLLIEMYQQEDTRIDVLAVGPRAEVAVGCHDGTWHNFDSEYPTVDELLETVNELHEIDRVNSKEHT